MPGPGFKIEDAYSFADSHGLGEEASKIRALKIHPSLKKPSTVRKGHFVEVFEQRGLMEEFALYAWPARYTPPGENRRALFLSYKDLAEQRLIDSGDLPLDEDEEEDGSPIFTIEAQLRDFIARNLTRISVASKRLKLFTDANERSGIEYPTAVGRIDVLGVDEDGNLYVFELKLERGPDRALGQLARYMGWVKLNLALGKKVVGVIVASSIDEELRYAAQVIPDVVLLEYELEFRLKDVAPLIEPAVSA